MAILNVLAHAGHLVQFLRALRPFLREKPSLAEVEQRIRADLARRGQRFLHVLERGVFMAPGSPYRRLLDHAGLGFADVRALVQERGLEPTLDALYDAGVFVRTEEFKGRVPIRRGSLELEVTEHDFDNPLIIGHLTGRTGGSRSAGSRLKFSVDTFAETAASHHVFLAALGILERPLAVWRAVPPGHLGLAQCLILSRLGRPAERWFSLDRRTLWSSAWKDALLLRAAVLACRLYGRPIPAPEHVPLDQAWRVARWLAEKKAAGTPAVLSTNVASGVRVCLAAREAGLDIEGSVFRLGSEPLTPRRRAVIGEAGARVACTYAMNEAGLVALGCPHAREPDEAHLLADRVALIRRPLAGLADPGAASIVLTAFAPATAKLMINVEVGDHAVLETAACGCPLEALGYGVRLHTIRSHEKLTSEGLNFLGHDVLRLVEEVLPERFGGAPIDYQLVEDEDERGMPRIRLLISPRVGRLDEARVVDTVVGFLNRSVRLRSRVADRWREGEILEVVRREPYATTSAKVLALHVMKPKDGAREGGEAVREAAVDRP